MTRITSKAYMQASLTSATTALLIEGVTPEELHGMVDAAVLGLKLVRQFDAEHADTNFTAENLTEFMGKAYGMIEDALGKVGSGGPDTLTKEGQ